MFFYNTHNSAQFVCFTILGEQFQLKCYIGALIPINSETGFELTTASAFTMTVTGYSYCVTILGIVRSYQNTPIVNVIGGADGSETYSATVSTTTSWPETGLFRFRYYNNKWYFKPFLARGQQYFDILLFGGRR